MIPKIMRTNPIMQTMGATLIRLGLNISGLKPSSTVVPGPDIRINPIKMITAAMPMIIRFFLPNAKLLLDIYFIFKFQIVYFFNI